MKKYQCGQVLPLGLALVVFGLVGALTIYNSGVAATDKMRLANSADAAAYSAALWQARALNYQAYANRAMVANQVAIGQAVSLKSWITYAAVTGENLATATKAVPFLNVVTGGIQVATISVVARETDGRFTSNSVYGLTNKGLNAIDWLAFNSRYTATDREAMKERQEIILASSDDFTRARNWDLFDFWIPSSFITFHKLRRQGETTLVAVDTDAGMEWEWMAKDTLSFHTKTLGFFGSDTLELPVGWASAFANSRNDSKPLVAQGCNSCERYTRNNHDAERLADRNVNSLAGRQTLKPMRGYGGVRSFWVLSDRARNAEDARLTIRVEVTLPAQKISESNTLINAENLDAPIVVAGNVMSSISAADVFYKHPQHYEAPASRQAKANLYNPYWQAQLSPVNAIERNAVILTRAEGASPTSVARQSSNTKGLGQYQNSSTLDTGEKQ